MAGVSPKEIKNRIRSMESTKQITGAMEMVAASKLRRAQTQMQSSRPYFEILRSTIDTIAANNRDFSSPYLAAHPVKKVIYIVIAGDRGLAGGYNSSILKLAAAQIDKRDAIVLPIGKKAVDFFRTGNTPMLSDEYDGAGDFSLENCFAISRQLCNAYLAGEFDEIHVVYTHFDSILSQTPAIMQLLPLKCAVQSREGIHSDFLYEPNREEVFGTIVPEYLGGILYGTLCESRASEQAARRTAMDSATTNAGDMITLLRQSFNRSRQAAITQQITEIVAGS